MGSKLIVILIDGLSADYFATCRARLPHLSALADEGWLVNRLSAEVCATSLPGRTSMLTGLSAAAHGVYGNQIWQHGRFRYANPDDVRVPTIACRALQAGLDVAAMGYTLVKPEDASLFQPPWWVGEWLQRGRDPEPLPIDDSWRRALRVKDPHKRLAALAAKGMPERLPCRKRSGAQRSIGEYIGKFASDHTMLQWVTGLAISDRPPDLILTEIAMTDDVQHQFGYKSDAAHWSIAAADALVGMLAAELRRTGRWDDYAVAVTSDHGHSRIDTAIYPEVLLGATPWQAEGSMLHVVPRDTAHRRDIETALADFGVSPYSSDHLPVEVRDRVATFAAPLRHSFEAKSKPANDDRPTGKPRAVSSHGLPPGSPEDDRFAVFAGKGVPSGALAEAEAGQFAPTLAMLLGLDSALRDYPAEPVFMASGA